MIRGGGGSYGPPFLFPGPGYASRHVRAEENAETTRARTSAAPPSRARDEEEVEQAKEEMSELEEGDPPEKLEDWPGGKAKYLTYGGPDGGESYDDGATSKLGPSSLATTRTAR